jgi:ABC-type proline/glycine betaine transport system permease subunit
MAAIVALVVMGALAIVVLAVVLSEILMRAWTYLSESQAL